MEVRCTLDSYGFNSAWVLFCVVRRMRPTMPLSNRSYPTTYFALLVLIRSTLTAQARTYRMPHMT
eukprot:3709110-Amphidinium_carterae.1